MSPRRTTGKGCARRGARGVVGGVVEENARTPAVVMPRGADYDHDHDHPCPRRGRWQANRDAGHIEHVHSLIGSESPAPRSGGNFRASKFCSGCFLTFVNLRCSVSTSCPNNFGEFSCVHVIEQFALVRS